MIAEVLEAAQGLSDVNAGSEAFRPEAWEDENNCPSNKVFNMMMHFRFS